MKFCKTAWRKREKRHRKREKGQRKRERRPRKREKRQRKREKRLWISLKKILKSHTFTKLPIILRSKWAKNLCTTERNENYQ